MKENLFSKTLLYWKKLSFEQKKKALQDFEILNSILDNREAREVVLSRLSNNSALGEYNHKDPSFLYINKEYFADVSGAQLMDATRHEGYHALMHDFTEGRANFTIIGNISKQKVIEGKTTDLVANATTLANSFVSSCHILNVIGFEERLVRRQTALYFLYNFLNMCENVEDLTFVFSDYKGLFLDFYDYNKIVAKCGTDTLEEYARIRNKVEKSFCEGSLISVIDDALQTVEIESSDKNAKPSIMKVRESALISFYKIKLQKSSNDKDVVKTNLLTDDQISFLTNYFDTNLKGFVEIQKLGILDPNRDKAEKQFRDNFKSAALTFDLKR